MDTCLIHPAILLLDHDGGQRSIYLLVLDAVLHALAFQQGDELLPDEIALLSLPLPTARLVLVELQVLKDDALATLLSVLDDPPDHTANVVVPLFPAAVQDAVVDERLGYYQVAVRTHV